MEGIVDPERNKIYLKLIQSIRELSDRARQDILSHYSGWHTYWVKQQTEKEQKLTGEKPCWNVDDLMFKSELDEWLKLSNEINPDPEIQDFNTTQAPYQNIFNHFGWRIIMVKQKEPRQDNKEHGNSDGMNRVVL